MNRSAADLFADVSTSNSGSGWVTAHCDGGARGNPGPSGFGALLQDDAGVVLAELSEFLGVCTNNVAEYSGLLGCLEWAIKHGHRRLRVVSDSELMVKQIQGKYKVNSPDLRPLWEEARRRIGQLEKFEISHALRHKNKAADRLANEAMDRGMKRPSSAGESREPATTVPDPAKSSAERRSERESPGATGRPVHQTRPEPAKSAPIKSAPQMLRGFTRNGAIHLLGGTTLPDGIFVKIIPE